MSAYYAYNIYQDNQRWLDEISKETQMALNIISHQCIKEGLQDKNDFIAFYQEFRNHEAIMSWIALQNMNITHKEERNILTYDREKQEHEKRILKNIKEEVIQNGTFDKYMRLYCAGNKILADANYQKGNYKNPSLDYSGEFKNSKPDLWSAGWSGRKVQKKIIAGYLNAGFTFDKVRDKYYGMYKALTYALYNNLNNDRLEEEIVKPWNEFLKQAIKPEFMNAFKDEFRRYRYLGGSCEFDATEVYKMKLFHHFYSQLTVDQKRLQKEEGSFNWRAQAKRQAIIAILTGGVILITGGIAGAFAYGDAHQAFLIDGAHQAFEAAVANGATQTQIQAVAGLRDQVVAGIPGATEKLNALTDLMKQYPVEFCNQTITGNSGNCHIVFQDISGLLDHPVNQTLTQLPANQIDLSWFQSDQVGFQEAAMNILNG